MPRAKNKKRINTNFRQTPRAFRSAKQAQVFSHINRNLPVRIFHISKNQFQRGLRKINRIAIREKFVKYVKSSNKLT